MSSTQATATVQAPPTLTIKLDEKTVPMTVHAIRIDVHIAGTVSRTTLVVTFENPHDRDLEGELTFPLPDGAALCGYPSGHRLLENGVIGVSGRLLKDDAQLTLRLGHGNEETERRTYPISRRAATSTGLIGQLWAQQKVDELSVLAERHGAELLELGRRFHIVTPNASLLVLETLDQHLEHGIAPSSSRSKMRKAYDRHISRRRSEEVRRQESKLDQVSAWWQDRVQWWEKEFDPAPPPVRDEPEGRVLGEDRSALLAEPLARYMRASENEPAVDSMLQDEGDMACMAAIPPGEALDTNTDPKDAEETSASITVKPWNPKTPYLEKLKSAGKDEAYDIYLEQRTAYGRSPSFYLDCADYLFKIGQWRLAIRVLTSVAELDLESPQLLRILAYKLETEGELVLASRILVHILAMRPEEPQSYRDLAITLRVRKIR
jgi:hypothetical protein